jgi:dTDP-4-amino-4,6-dideoxygalactose transaminase
VRAAQEPERAAQEPGPAAAVVRLFDLSRQVEELKAELSAAAARVLASGRYVLGPEVQAFEREAAGYLGVPHAVGVASGTDAIELALRAAGIGAGEGVLTTPFTFFATVSAILAAGAVPVFADIDPGTYNLDPSQIRRVLAGRSPVHRRLSIEPAMIRALVPVHLYGQPARMEELSASAERQGLVVVEDAAQAFGAEQGESKAGALASAGCFSFFPTKNLGGFGDGGLVATSDGSLAGRLRLLRAHGVTAPYLHRLVGTNSRLDELQAALLRIKLRRLDGWVAQRRAHAAAYDAALAKLEGIMTPHASPGCKHTYHQYTLRVGRGARESLQNFLAAAGVETRVYYPLPLHLQPALRHLGYRKGDFPHAEQASREVLSLPMFPELIPAEIEHVTRTIRRGLEVGFEDAAPSAPA